MRGLSGFLCLALTSSLSAQTPQPFPTPRGSTPPPPAPAAPASPRPAAPAAPAAQGAPDLGDIPVYPNAVYLASYDAGRGQRFHIYGVQLTYAEAVGYYQAALNQRGDQLYESPPTHQFELGRFRDSEMSYPPSVTVKDFTWSGGTGYANPQVGGTPDRFPTVVQIVPPPRLPQ